MGSSPIILTHFDPLAVFRWRGFFRVPRAVAFPAAGTFQVGHSSCENPRCEGVIFVVKLTLREGETVQEAVRRFRKLVERSGLKKEMRRRDCYEKKSEINRRIRLRAERRSKRLRANPQ